MRAKQQTMRVENFAEAEAQFLAFDMPAATVRNLFPQDFISNFGGEQELLSCLESLVTKLRTLPQ